MIWGLIASFVISLIVGNFLPIIFFALGIYFLKDRNNNEDLIETSDSSIVFQKSEKLGEIVNKEDRYNNDLLFSNFSSMLEDSIFSDVSIQCGSENFKAHKCILSARSPVFETMFKSPMKENKENIVVVKEIDPEAVKAMLEHLYTGKVTSPLTTSTACELLALSDMYELNGLKKSSVSILLSHLSNGNAVKLLINGNLYDELLKLHAAQYICSKFEIFQNNSEWLTLREENPSLAMDIMTAKINYMKLNNVISF